MPDVVEQMLAAETSPSQDAALSDGAVSKEPSESARPEVGATAEKSASPDASATADQSGQDQTEAQQDKDWKAEYEKAQVELHRRDQGYRQQEARRRQAEQQAMAAQQQLDAVKQARAERVQEILADENKQIEIAADPVARQAFIKDIVQVEMDKRDAVEQQQIAQFQQQMAQRQWDRATVDLMQWACIRDDGPKLSQDEWNQWLAQNSRMYNDRTFDTPEEAMESAQNSLRGQYLPKIVGKVRQAAEKDAAQKAKQTLVHGAPPGSASVNIGAKGKTPAQAWLDDLESPGLRSINDLFK